MPLKHCINSGTVWQAAFLEGNTVIMVKAQVTSTRQPVKRLSAWSRPIEIPYEDDLIHHLEDDGTISHDPLYPDPDCPCYEEDEQGDTSSQLAAAMNAYQHDFYSLSPIGDNTGGTWLERRVAERVLAFVAW